MIYSINLQVFKQMFKRSNNTNTDLAKEQENIRNTVHQRYRTNILFAFTLFTLTLTLCFCWEIVNNPDSNPERIKFAFTLITAIVSGLVGFITGKAVS